MKTIKIFLFVLFCVIGFSQKSIAQCCAFGTPTAGTTNVGIVPEDNLRISAFYRVSNSETYFHRTQELQNYGSVKRANYSYLGMTLGYGLLDKLSIEAEFGYFINKKQDIYLKRSPVEIYTLENNGINNAVISAKYNIWDDSDLNLQWTLGTGIKIPFETETQENNGVELPIDLQTSTHAYGLVIQSLLKKSFDDIGINLLLLNRVEINAKDKAEYRYGNSYTTSFFATKQIIENLIGILQFRSEIKDKDEEPGIKTKTGSALLFISPQLSYTFNEFNLSLLYEYPIYRNYYEPQLSVKQALSINLSYEFEL